MGLHRSTETRLFCDPVLDSQVDFFEAGMKVFTNPVSPAEQRRAARRLHELAVEIRFHLGDPQSADSTQSGRVIALFKRATQAMTASGDVSIARIGEHMRTRVEEMQEPSSPIFPPVSET